MEQVPPPTTVSVVPETVQTDMVVEAKLTVRLDVDEALRVMGETPYVWLLSVPKVMVCEAGLTVKLCVTSVAAA